MIESSGTATTAPYKRPYLANDMLLLAVAAVWGTSYGLTKEVLLVYPVLAFLVLRFSLTTLMLSVPLIWELKRDAHRLLRVSVPTGCILLAIFLCEIYGVLHTQATNAAVLISLFVVFTPLVEWLLLKKKPPKEVFTLAIASVFGIYLLTDGSQLSFNIGDALILSAALLRACMVTVTNGLSRKYNGSTTAMTAMQSLIVALGASILFYLFSAEEFSLPSTNRSWLVIVYLVVFCTIFAFFAQNYASRRCNPSRVSLLMGSEPVFGALFAMAWLNESIHYQGWAGLTIIILSCIGITRVRQY